MNYVASIEPRLTAHRPTSPETSVQALTDWLHDLEQEARARLDLITDEQLRWSPHPDANHPGVTFWHVARWLDVLAATRAVTAAVPGEQAWIRAGWIQRTGYDPRGIGFLGLGTLTGYSAEQMRAVPGLGREGLKEYLQATVADLAAVLASFDVADLNRPAGFGSPFQLVGSTLQGSFGHLGEIDSMVSLYDRLHATPEPRSETPVLPL